LHTHYTCDACYEELCSNYYFYCGYTLINVMGGSSEHRALFPWAAAGDIANHTLPSTYPPEYSYTAIIVTALTGFIALIVYFKKVAIHLFYCAVIGRDC